jgi:transposase
MVAAMICGERDPLKLAALTDRRLKATAKELYDALHGRLAEQHGSPLKLHLARYDGLGAAIQALDGRIEPSLACSDAQRVRTDAKVKAGQWR